ncbi:hypothetical protein KOR34_41270 [Posidoniimonas corsicana]|uniref:LamG-like jellyroll fold domain-containing protein n=1 Tax=Posidoniimonas corsicana TaxID=1938618 RepID=A0A5C5V175_9BACT|nr:LamG-like jellyroll fold domain-containing protein [Posidoniimonas corsicana]TWT32364.1 hypothetical protein KOR34_41270 [Posidoniimonas corsicana]
MTFLGARTGGFLALALAGVLASRCCTAQTLSFSYSSAGVTTAMTDWGADTAWPSANNVRQSIQHLGLDQIDVMRVNFYSDEALQANGSIGPFSMARLDNQLSLAALAGDKPISIVPHLGDAVPSDPSLTAGTNPYYRSGSQLNEARWVDLLRATQTYIQSQGWTVAEIEPFNEPDFDIPGINPEQGSPQNLLNVMNAMKADASFDGVKLVGPSTLNANVFPSWWSVVKGPADYGSSHALAGSRDDYVNFIQQVQAEGDTVYNPEIHSIAEMLYGANYGMQGGIFWGPNYLSRGLLVNSIADGKRLAYAENPNPAYSTAAAVYRDADGAVRAFAGGFERDYQGDPSTYRVISTDQDLYFNGVGPMREYTMRAAQSTHGSYVEIEADEPAVPALDGHRWKIVELAQGRALEVAGGGVGDGINIQVAPLLANDSPNLARQTWDIVRVSDDGTDGVKSENEEATGYYQLLNTNSGGSAEVRDFSLNNGGNVWQYGQGEFDLRQWFIEPAGDGAFHLRNGYSHKYLSAQSSSSNVNQNDLMRGSFQKWRFVLANPALSESVVARYGLDANPNDSSGSGNHASPTGRPGYVTGKVGDAINLDGVDDYLTLPAGVGNSEGITVSAWVNWDGNAGSGLDWQRIFDFGNPSAGLPQEYMFLTPRSGNGGVRFAISAGSSAGEHYLETTDPLPTDEWVHVAVTLGGNTAVLYLNGEPVIAGDVWLNPEEFGFSQNYIGKSQWNDPLFNGRIDDFRIYDYALHSSQIASLLNPLPGDFNGDGVVDAADYTVWRDNLGEIENGVPLFGNGDGGVVGQSDWAIWAANFGASLSNGGGGEALSSAPEPSSVCLAAILALLCGGRGFQWTLGRDGFTAISK